MRHFFFRIEEHLLTNDLGSHKARWLVGELIFGKVCRTNGQGRHYFLQEQVESVSFQRGKRDDFLEVVQALVVCDQRQQSFLVFEQVDLVQQQEDRCLGLLGHLESELVFSAELFGDIKNQEDEVTGLQRLTNLDHHFASERTVGLVHAGRIDEHNLRARALALLGQVNDALNPVARSL